jgi:hypothetical protein
MYVRSVLMLVAATILHAQKDAEWPMYNRDLTGTGRAIGSFTNPQTGWPCNAPPWRGLGASRLAVWKPWKPRAS